MPTLTWRFFIWGSLQADALEYIIDKLRQKCYNDLQHDINLPKGVVMFVPATSNRPFMVVAALLASITMLVGCSSSSETPKTSTQTASQQEWEEYNSQFNTEPRFFEEKDPNDSPEGLREWSTPSGKRCWDHDEGETSAFGGKELWGPAMADYLWPLNPDAPVATVNEVVDKVREIDDECGGGSQDERMEQVDWLVANTCENFTSGEQYLWALMLGFRYFDGTDYSAMQCPNNLKGDGSLRVVVPRGE